MSGSFEYRQLDFNRSMVRFNLTVMRCSIGALSVTVCAAAASPAKDANAKNARPMIVFVEHICGLKLESRTQHRRRFTGVRLQGTIPKSGWHVSILRNSS
jgi:hypothetical protein